MVNQDPRLVIGAKVSAKAMHVTSEAECGRRYGANKKTKMLEGFVLEVQTENTATNRTKTFVLARYNLGGDTLKDARLNIRSVKALPSAEASRVDEISNEDNATTDRPTRPFVEGNPQAEDETGVGHGSTSAPNPVPTTQAEEGRQEAAEVPTAAATPAATPALAATTAPVSTIASPANTPLAQHTAPTAASINHGVSWFSNIPEGDTNGPHSTRSWSVHTAAGETFREGSDPSKSFSRLDYFLIMFPIKELNHIVALTNENLRHRNGQEGNNNVVLHRPTTAGEILKFFGIVILATRFEFGRRSDLWSTTASSKYVPAPNFGSTGMPRQRFDLLFSTIRFSAQPKTRPESVTSEQYRWMLIDDFVEYFNEHRKFYVIPGDVICVDESMSRWYGQGGNWINHGLPMYIAIDRKPENGCEIQNAACGRSGIIVKLNLVKTATEQEEQAAATLNPDGNDGEEVLPHGGAILKMLVMPWAQSDRIVCADSYFASVTAAKELMKIGLRFIGVVKTATRKYPMAHLAALELQTRGERKGLTTVDGDGVRFLAYVWMDRDRRYFISTASSLAPGAAYSRHRWRQVDTTPNSAPERVELVIPQPKACELYYSACGQIDRHNRCRQDDLNVEKKIGTLRWDMRLNLSLLSMCIVDTWLLYKGATTTTENQKLFYERLAEELIDNRYDTIGNAPRQRAREEDVPLQNTAFVSPRSGLHAHLTPTKKKRKTNNGGQTNYRFQAWCRECSNRKTTHLCSLCEDSDASNLVYICHTKGGRTCFQIHMDKYHK